MDKTLSTRAEEPSPLQLIGAIVNSPDVTMEKVAIAEKLMGMRREMKQDDAKEAFFASFVKMQRQIKNVKAEREVKNDKGEIMYTFAAFEDIRKEADPILEAHGFGVCFDTRDAGDRLVSVFTLMHEGGHSKSNEFAVRYSGPPKTSAAQADASTKTMAMKGAFCDGVGIVIAKYADGADGRVMGDRITPEQAEDFRARLRVLGKDEAAFLSFAQSDSFENITHAMLNPCEMMLAKAERIHKKPLPPGPGTAPCDEHGNLL